MNKHKIAAISIGSLALGSLFLSSSVFGIGSTSGNVQLDTEIATSIAMKIASPNDTNPDCTPESGVTYGVANRYASSTGDNSGKVVDTFDGREGEKDEVNTNTSCATLSMSPNTYDSTYSDVTVYTNSGTGYALSVRSADNTSPNLVNTEDSTLTIPAGTLTEQDGTGEQAGQKVVPGGQNKWAIKTDTGVIDTWTAVTTEDQTVRAYDQATNNGDTTRVTYGISAGNNPAGKYTTTLTYTATMFDGPNPYIAKVDIPEASNLSVEPSSLSIPYRKSATITVTPDTGYYLSSITCPEGLTCSGYETDVTKDASAGPQTITLTNNSENSIDVSSIVMTSDVRDLWIASGCDSATKDSPCTVNGVQYIKLLDGHYWTRSSQGTGTFYTASGKCPSGTNYPSTGVFQGLVNRYGTGSGLYNATGWSGTYWASGGSAYVKDNGTVMTNSYLNVSGSSAGLHRAGTACDSSGCYQWVGYDESVVCYR